MNKGLLTILGILISTSFLFGQNPSGDLRIEMLKYYNLVVDHNIQTPAGASPKSVYIGIKICNDGNNDMEDVFAFIGDYDNVTPGIYPTETPSGMPYSGTFSFTHEGGVKDATRFIGTIPAGECITQYWLVSYPLVDANNNPVFGDIPKQNDDLQLTYDVWAYGNDNGSFLEANDTKTVQLRAEQSASANKIWPNTTSKVPTQFLNAFPDKELGWRQTTNTTHPGASVVLEGIWFDLGNVNKGFDNDGDYQKDYNFLLQPVGNPSVYDPNCFRLVKVSGLIVVKPKQGSDYSFEFEDQLHFEDMPINTGIVGMVFYEFAVLNGPCSAELSPYQEAASGKNNEKFNSDYGTPGGTLTSPTPTTEISVSAPPRATPGDIIDMTISTENTSSVELGNPQLAAPIVIEQEIPSELYYVAGSAETGNTLPLGMAAGVLYSTDGGSSWLTTEPNPTTSVDKVMWVFNSPLQPGDSVEVTYQLYIPVDYDGSNITTESDLATGGAEPFGTGTASIIVEGSTSFTDVVFLDNGDGGGILGNGVQDGTEAGLPNVKVTIYNDIDENEELDNSDLYVSETESDVDGVFSFTDLSDGSYILAIDLDDSDLPLGLTNTTPALYAFSTDAVPSTTFGLAQIIEVTNTLVSADTIFESDYIDYQLQIENMTHAEDTDNSSTVIAWASQLDADNEFNNFPNNLLGEPDDQLSWASSWLDIAKVNGFDFSGETGTIEKVEIILSISLDQSINNDYLRVSFEAEDGSTVYAPNPVLGKNSTPSLNDYVGSQNHGWIIIDVTDDQDWDWNVFDAQWAVTVEGKKVGSNDNVLLYADAIGVRVTSECCASSNGEPGSVCATVTQMPVIYEYDNSQFEFISSSVPADQVSNGQVVFSNLAPLYPNEIQTVDLRFRALQPEQGSVGGSVVTNASVSFQNDCTGVEATSSALADTVTIINLGSVSGFVFGDADGDGWVGTTGYEPITDVFIPGVEVFLYGCYSSTGDLIYPASNDSESCTHASNSGHWELVKIDTTDENGYFYMSGINNGFYYIEIDETSLTNSGEQTADPDFTSGLAGSFADKRWKDPNADLRDGGIIGIGNDHTNVNFGYHNNSTIQGYIWNDLNGDGVKDANEGVVTYVPVEFNHSGCTSGVDCDIILTDGDGLFTYNTVLADVEYTLTVDLSSITGADSWAITYEADGTADNSSSISLSEDESRFDVHFGIQASGPINMGGTVYYDWSGDAHQNSGDEGIPDIRMRLYQDVNGDGTVQTSDQLVGTISTDPNGDYLFANKPSDNYVITLEENDLVIFPRQTEDPDETGPCTVCDAKTAITNQEYTVSVTDIWTYHNAINSNCEICNEDYTSTDDPTYSSSNLDEIDFQDPIVDPLACVTELEVTFNLSASDFDKTYYTSEVQNVDYFYPIELNGVQIGTYNPEELPYSCGICESITVSFSVDLSTIPYNFGGTNTLDLNFYSFNQALPVGQRQDICIADIQMVFTGANCTTDYLSLDFAYQPTGGTGEIEGFVFLDENSNGLASNSEQRLSNVEVRLEADLNNDGVFFWIETTVSDADGNFNFDELIDGTYQVIVNELDSDIPSDYNGEIALLTTLGSQTIVISDSEITEVNGSACDDGCYDERPAFGFSMPGTVVGYVFSDDNGNGTTNEYEQGISGVQLFICNAVDGYCDATNALDTVTTSSGGILALGVFQFTGLTAGSYTVAVDETTLPSGYTLTADPSTNGIACYSPLDPLDENYDLLNTGCDHQDKGFSVSLGSQYAGAYFGYQPPGVVGGMVWFDDDGDGQLGDTEEGIEEVEIEITNLTPITIGSDSYNAGEYTDYVFTDEDGNYVFTNLPDGTYDVRVDVLTDYVLTYDVDGVLDSVTQVTLSAGQVTSAGNTWCSASDCSQDVDFGMSPNFVNTLAGVACLDGDEDGRCDTGGEAFPEGTIVNILDLNGEEYGETTVAADGTFFFDNLPTTNMVVSVSKTVAPLHLTSLTTSLGDTPAYDIQDSDNNAIQFVAVSGNVMDMHYGFTFSDTFDLGDLPTPYLTRADGASSGPAHIIPASPSLYLGATIDAESSPVLQSDALGDDANGIDDEDGIVFSDAGTWTEGADGGSLTAEITGNGYLIAYADFNFDGDFDDAGEMIINEAVITGIINYTFDIPLGTDLSGGQDIYFRFRLFKSAPFSPLTSYNGITEEGEVEDYMVSVCNNLTDPGTITGSETGCDGYDPTGINESVGITGGGGTIEYIWEESTDGGQNWSVIAGANSNTYDPPNITQTVRYRRGARRSRCSNFVYSNSVIKTVVTNYTDAGLIVGDEDNCGIFDPEIILNVVAPSGGLGTSTPFYQWEQSTDSVNWVAILNAHDEYFDPGNISQTTQYRRATRKTPCGDWLYSNVVTKMVSVNYISAGTIDGDEEFCGTYDPTPISSTSLPSGGIDGYEVMQWEYSTNNQASWTDISGATGATFDPGVISQTTWYRRKARRVPCSIWVNSNAVEKTVKPFPIANIITYPTSASGYLCELEAFEFDAEDAGANVDYTWDFGTYASPLTALGQGPHHITFDVPNANALTNTIVTLTTEKDGCVSTDNRPLSFRPEIVIDSVITTDPSQCQQSDGIIEIYATRPSGTSIEYSVNDGLTWSTMGQFSGQGAGVYDIRVRYLGGDCIESYGAVALSDPPPQSVLNISSIEECTGQTIVIEAIPIASNPVFTWTFGNGAIPNTIAGAGPHSVYFTQGGYASIAVTMEENNCIGVRDTAIAIVENYTEGGTILGGETLCSTFDPANIVAGSNPSGGIGGSLVYQWESREDDGLGGYTAWQDVVGANAASYDPGIISATTEFRRKARRAPCSDWVASNSVIARLVQKPNLGDDTYYTVCPGFPHADNVSDNDFNLVNAEYTLSVFPTNGILDFEIDGEFIYDPSSTYCGTDEFQYVVCNDATGCCDTAHVLIDLTDINPPSILNVPNDIVISCDDQIPVADAVDIMEDCQTVSIGTDEFTTQGTDSCALNNYLISRIWNGVDYCSNSAASQQTIAIQDKTAPDIYRIYTLPNGKRMVAGVMENVSNHWKTVGLPIQFSGQPVIFTQVTSRNDMTPVVAKLRNVSTTQFQLKLQEEENNDGVHAVENVAWIAFEKGTYSGATPFEIDTWLMNSTPSNHAFGQSYSATPNLFASIQTNNESDPATVRFYNLTDNGVDTWVNEEVSADSEVDHDLETVGYMAIEGSDIITNDKGEVIGEMGRIDLSNSNMSISFDQEYHNPVVIISAVTSNENEPVNVRVLSVSTTGFSVLLQEWDYQDGVHAIENLSYMVIEGSLPLNKTVDCDNIPESLKIGSEIIAMDNCDATIQLIMTEDDFSFDCMTDTTFVRSWYTTDDCGNITQLSETYILKDTIAPTFTVPTDVTIVCTDDKDDLDLTGQVIDELDNCSVIVTISYTDDVSNLVGCNGHIIRTWKATDNCGNETIKEQYIYVSPEEDTDQDGVVDYFDLDDDNDGIPDLVETSEDSDNDGIPNDKDLDSDNDGIPDIIETEGEDSNGDGIVDIIGEDNWDNDNDGLAFGFDGNDIDPSEEASVVFDKTSSVNDRDGDGIPNFLDRDSDNDAIPDLIEIGGVDTNGDGVIDYPILADPSSMEDNDHDGFNDVYDPDDDNQEGIEDPNDPLVVFNGEEYTGGQSTDQLDADGDMVPDFFDIDSDNDGTGDLIEIGGIDLNGDGRLELTANFVDLNNDGFSDIYVTYPLILTDDDGSNEDGRPEDTDGDNTVYVQGDTDFDGSPNHTDTDSDSDNIKDILETGQSEHDGDNDGIWDNWVDTNNNGFDDIAEASANIMTEDDGVIPDGKPEDSGDADESSYLSAQPDGSFAETNGTPDIDDDGDGLLNFLDSDSDNDFLPDSVEDSNHNNVQDDGETGIYNPDSDYDQIKDGIEDKDKDGIYDPGETDPLNPNTDGDGLQDGEEDLDFDGVITAIESDPTNACDPILNQACRGIALNVKIQLKGALIDQDSFTIMRDDLRYYGKLPENEPYSELPHLVHIGVDDFDDFTIITGGGVANDTTGNNGSNGNTNGNGPYKEFCDPGNFYITGFDAPVDWVMVELRSAEKQDSVIATRAGLVQRDGDVRDIDNISYLTFANVPSGSYYVAIRHRNHLGIVTANTHLLSPSVTTIDFTDPATEVYEDDAMSNTNGKMALWAGDLNGDGKIIYQGPWNDILTLFQNVVLSENNEDVLANYIVDGYNISDFNMDGYVIYQGPRNDKAKLLIHSILSAPENILGLANFVIIERLP